MLVVCAGGRSEMNDSYEGSREEVDMSGRNNWNEAKSDQGCPLTGSWVGPAEGEE